MSAGLDVSVIIAARNAAGAMPGLLAALQGQTLASDRFEVIVVDDRSDDGTAQAVRHAAWPVLLATERRGGAYAARNLGLARARGRQIAITDADCQPAPGWLENALADLKATGADVLAGHIEVPLRTEPSLAETIDFARYLDQERALREAGFGATANLVARRVVFERVGAFNDRLVSGGDREWCLRARAAGHEIAYSSRAEVRHVPRRRARDLAKKGYRFGVGAAQGRAHADGTDSAPRVCSDPGCWLPSLYGLERLTARGRRPGRLGVARFALGEWAWVQVPMLTGDAVGSVRELWRARARGAA